MADRQSTIRNPQSAIKIFTQATEQIARWRRPLLITHVKPDGDALGSLIAMRSVLQSQGIEARAILFDAIPDRYAVFRRYPAMPVFGADVHEADLTDIDAVLVLDTCSYSQLDPIADWLRSATVPKLAVDHHVTRDELADYYVIDESAAACCLILYDWVAAVDWPMAPETRDALFIGMAMDTGWFRHSNTDERVLSAVADLVARGADLNGLCQGLFQCDSPARVRLLGAALGTMELLANDRLAMMTLSTASFAECGATPADTEDIVHEPLRIGSVAVSVLLVEETDGVIRASFRCKPPLHTDKRGGAPSLRSTGGGPTQTDSVGPLQQGRRTDINVAKVAQAFGGGGHSRAAGARLRGTLPDVRRAVVEHLQSVLAEPSVPEV